MLWAQWFAMDAIVCYGRNCLLWLCMAVSVIDSTAKHMFWLHRLVLGTTVAFCSACLSGLRKGFALQFMLM